MWFDESADIHNIGDYLSLVIVEYMASKLGIDLNKRIKKTKFISAVGSILFFTNNDRTVWGSGIMAFDSYKKTELIKHMLNYKVMQKIDVRLVRGPETKRVLDIIGVPCPCLYGDPALLISEIYKPIISDKSDYVVCPHWTEDHKYSENYPIISMQTKDWKETLNKLCSTNLVISSSLHGIILAEAYGIPAILLKTDNQDIFKYNDYYYSTGRYQYPIVESVEEALKITPSIPDPHVMDKLRNNIRNTFPKDLWD